MFCMEPLCPLACVRASCSFVTASASSVSIDDSAVAAVALHWRESKLLKAKPTFDRTLHFVDESRPALTVQCVWRLWSILTALLTPSQLCSL